MKVQSVPPSAKHKDASKKPAGPVIPSQRLTEEEYGEDDADLEFDQRRVPAGPLDLARGTAAGPHKLLAAEDGSTVPRPPVQVFPGWSAPCAADSTVPAVVQTSGSATAPQPPQSRQIVSALQQQLPPDRIAARIAEMIQAQQTTGSGDVATDWRTVEAGIRLYMEYATTFPTPAGTENLSNSPQVHKTTQAEKASLRRETHRIYSKQELLPLETVPFRSSLRVLPTKNLGTGALEPIENMRKRLVHEIPLTALQESDGRKQFDFSMDVPNDPEFDLTPRSLEPVEAEKKRALPLIALVACLVIGGIFASASQFHTKPLTSSIAQPIADATVQPVAPVPVPNQEIANAILNHFKPDEKLLWW